MECSQFLFHLYLPLLLLIRTPEEYSLRLFWIKSHCLLVVFFGVIHPHNIITTFLALNICIPPLAIAIVCLYQIPMDRARLSSTEMPVGFVFFRLVAVIRKRTLASIAFYTLLYWLFCLPIPPSCCCCLLQQPPIHDTTHRAHQWRTTLSSLPKEDNIVSKCLTNRDLYITLLFLLVAYLFRWIILLTCITSKILK